MGSSSGFLLRSHWEIINLVITTAVKNEVITPIDKVTAKPLTGPVPKNIK